MRVVEFTFSVDGRYSSRQGFRKALLQLLDYLRSVGAVPMSVPVRRTVAGALIQEFDCHLAEERGLAPSTRRLYCELIERFLAGRVSTQDDLYRLRREDVTGYVANEASRMTPKSVGAVVSALRSFLRFIYVYGKIGLDLAQAVPAVLASRRQRALPQCLEPGEVELVLATCDRTTPLGRRDYAILLALSRLGLRGGELIRMTLDDIDWRGGEIHVTGRPGRTDRLPLPVDLGTAIADYLRHGRPQSADRRVFIRRTHAPFQLDA